MTIWSKLKLMLKLKSLWAYIQDGFKLKEGEMKPGWKTTEFWLVMLTNAIAIVESLKGTLPPETAAIAITVLNCIYTIMRSITKKSGPQ